MSHVYLAVHGKRVFKLLKPGNTNGSAAVLVVLKLARPASNSIRVYNVSSAERPVRMGQGVNCLPRSIKFCSSVANSRGLVCATHLGNVSSTRTGIGTLRLVRRIKLTKRVGGGAKGCSHNVHRQLKLTSILVGGPRVVVLSRPASKVSPTNIRRFVRLVERLDQGRKLAILFSSRRLSRIRGIYSHIKLFGDKGLIALVSVSSLGSGRRRLSSVCGRCVRRKKRERRWDRLSFSNDHRRKGVQPYRGLTIRCLSKGRFTCIRKLALCLTCRREYHRRTR